jgi:divalent metal cation (Fe/Co/Zn/Cd) transporter
MHLLIIIPAVVVIFLIFRKVIKFFWKVIKGLLGKRPPAPIQFMNEASVQESDEIVGTEEYPLDNSFGDQAFITEREVSRESTNELSVDTSSHLGGGVSLEVLSAIKTEIEAQVTRQIGQKIGEKVTESQTLTFSVGPKPSVLYEVVWKRKVRSGELAIS